MVSIGETAKADLSAQNAAIGVSKQLSDVLTQITVAN
jgi:hypothetical protein